MMLRPADNPFGAQRIDAIPYEPRDQSWDELLARLREFDYRAAIIGPHGSGKTTLLESLHERLQEEGRPTRLVRLRHDDRRVPASFIADLTPETILLLDSAGCLGITDWLRVRRASVGAGGLIVTAHHRGLLPVLVRTRVDADLMLHLVEHLLDGPSPWSRDDLASRLRRHRGNARAVLRELYDRAGEQVQPV